MISIKIYKLLYYYHDHDMHDCVRNCCYSRGHDNISDGFIRAEVNQINQKQNTEYNSLLFDEYYIVHHVSLP